MYGYIIIGGLPYLYADGKAYAVRWDDEGFTIGAEVELAEAPERIYSELSIKAKCRDCLDSIGEKKQSSETSLDDMKVGELKAYAAEHGIDLGDAKKKADYIAIIKAAEK